MRAPHKKPRRAFRSLVYSHAAFYCLQATHTFAIAHQIVSCSAVLCSSVPEQDCLQSAKERSHGCLHTHYSFQSRVLDHGLECQFFFFFWFWVMHLFLSDSIAPCLVAQKLKQTGFIIFADTGINHKSRAFLAPVPYWGISARNEGKLHENHDSSPLSSVCGLQYKQGGGRA